MKLSIVSWNSTSINTGSPFKASIVSGQLANIRQNVVLVNREGDYPALSSVVKAGSTITIQVIIAGGQDINTNREILKGYFFGDNQRHDLIATDEADSSRQYYRRGFPVTFIEENRAPNSFYITI